MCRDTMDTTSKLVKTDYLRQTTKFESSPKCKPFCFSTEEDKALQHCRHRAARSNRKCIRRCQRRTQLAKLAKFFVDTTRNEEMESALKKIERHVPAGAMAPENTTQYLMSNVYEDMKRDMIQLVSCETPAHIYSGSTSPSSVYAELDCDYDGCLAFQQKDFEETFGLAWKPE